MSRRASPTQAEIARAIKAVQQSGVIVQRVEIDRDGKIVVISREAAEEPSAGDARSGIILRRLEERRHG